MVEKDKISAQLVAVFENPLDKMGRLDLQTQAQLDTIKTIRGLDPKLMSEILETTNTIEQLHLQGLIMLHAVFGSEVYSQPVLELIRETHQEIPVSVVNALQLEQSVFLLKLSENDLDFEANLHRVWQHVNQKLIDSE